MPISECSRRDLLAAGVGLAGTLGLAGCLSGDADDAGQGGTATTEPATATNRVGATTEAETETEGRTAGTASGPTDVTFEAPHEATIPATAYGGGDCGVVLVPQVNLDRGSWRPQAELVASTGRQALAIDEDPDDRAASVRGAIRYLREERGVSTVVLVGASTGGAAVVVANAETDVPVAGTVALSPAGGVDHADALTGRSLFVVATADEDRFVRIANDLEAAAPEPKELIEFEGSAHGQGLFESEHGEALRSRLQTFLDEACGS